MIKEILARIKQGNKTSHFPFRNIKLSGRYRGFPETNFSKLSDEEKKQLSEICPCDCFSKNGSQMSMDLGNCTFCGLCSAKMPEAVKFSKTWSMAVSSREDLIVKDGFKKKNVVAKPEIKKIFGRSLKLRQVSAGGCNACEADCNVLGTPVFDMARFGIQFVASPRHADGILITGPVTRNMYAALQKTYDAVPAPKLVIVVGSCAIGGGIYRGMPMTAGLPPNIKPDLFIPGCPPNPMTILDGILRLIGRK